MITVGVLDRTGTLIPVAAPAVRRLESTATVVDFGRPAEFGAGSQEADVLLLGPQELSAAGLRRAHAWRRAHPVSAAIAIVPPAQPAGSRDGLRGRLRAHGVGGLIRGPLTVGKALRALRGALTELDLLARGAAEWAALQAPQEERPAVAERDAVQAVEAEPEMQATLAPGSEQEEAPLAHRALVITVASAAGGCGKTFYATNLAALVAPSGRRILLVDLDLQFGELATALRIKHPHSLYDGLYDSRGDPLPEEAFGEHLHELVAHHPLGFDVLTAPREPVFADYVGASDAARVIEAVVGSYDVVIIDTPASLNEVVLTALDLSDLVVILATPDVPSLKNMSVFLDTVRRLKIESSHLRLILNKVEKDIGLEVKQVQDAFGGRFVGLVPQSRLVSQALNAGTVAVAMAPRSDVA
ncbi:MAG: AAA family ATPase, partial [Actinomycetota bacterium]